MTKQERMEIKKEIMRDFPELTSPKQIQVKDETLAIVKFSKDKQIVLRMDNPPR